MQPTCVESRIQNDAGMQFFFLEGQTEREKRRKSLNDDDDDDDDHDREEEESKVYQ